MFIFARKMLRVFMISLLSVLIPLIVVPSHDNPRADIAFQFDNFSLDRFETISFTEDNSVISNPERGWYRAYFTDNLWGLGDLERNGIRVIMLKADLKDYKSNPISETKLKEIENAFNMARRNGLQVIFRAAYDFIGDTNSEPQEISTILGHIGQLKKIFHDNEDILNFVQAGFLGPWGEWHSSSYGDPIPLEVRKTVLFALMDAVPESRSIQVRRPMFIRDIFENSEDKSTISDSTAFNKSYLSRTGYHNDALLSTENEYGTYVDPSFSRQDELDWIENHTKYTPFAGETCYLSEKSDPENAVYELDKLNAQLINIDYHPDVIGKWYSTEFKNETTYDYISKNLGYRFVLKQASITNNVLRGGALRIDISLVNEGFGNLTNERKVEVVLTNGRNSYATIIDEDPRFWTKEKGEINLELYFKIPNDINLGKWSLYLNLPGASEDTAKDSRYSVRFANEGIWNAKSGYNLITDNIRIYDYSNPEMSAEFIQISRIQAEEIFEKSA